MGEEKSVVLTANYSIVEPLFALHLLGTIRDHGRRGTFFPVRKYDFEPLFRRVEEFGATDVGFNVYSGNHTKVYKAADELRRRGVTVHIGGPHATYFAERSAEHADWVFRGQSYDSFGAYLDGPEAFYKFFRMTTLESIEHARLMLKMKEHKDKHGREPVDEEVKRMMSDISAQVGAIADSPQTLDTIAKNMGRRIAFRKFLSNTFPNSDRQTFYADNPDMLLNPIKNSVCGEGCPFACTYCYNVAWNSDDMYGRFKRRIVRNIDDQLEELAGLRNFNTKLIFFQDDVFGFEMQWLREFMPRYAERVGIPFHAQLRLELTNGEIGRERLRLMKEAGCTGITVAVESGDYIIRRDILDRPMTDKHIFMGFRNIRESGVATRTEQMLGLFGPQTKPGDNPIDYCLKTLRTNCLIRPSIAWSSIYAPFGGTEAGRQAVERRLYPAEKLATNDDISDSFFDETVLDYAPEYKYQVRALQRLFNTFSHIDRGHEIAETFLKDEMPRHDTAAIEGFLAIAKELTKITKLTLYDNELYHTQDERAHGAYSSMEGCRPGVDLESQGVSGTNTKSRMELLALQEGDNGRRLTLDDIAAGDWNQRQRAALDSFKRLWSYVPRGEVIAEKFLGRLPTYSPAQQDAFNSLAQKLGRITDEVIAKDPLDREAEIQRLISEEEKMLAEEKSRKCESGDRGYLADQSAPKGHQIVTISAKV